MKHDKAIHERIHALRAGGHSIAQTASLAGAAKGRGSAYRRFAVLFHDKDCDCFWLTPGNGKAAMMNASPVATNSDGHCASPSTSVAN